MGRIQQKQIKIMIAMILIGVMLIGTTILAENDEPGEVNVPIVTYHRIMEKPLTELDLTPKQLEEQFRFFQEQGYQPLTATQLLDYQENATPFPEKPLVLTFDDGPLSNYTYVFPLLKKFGWQATFFIYPKVIAEKSKTQLTWGQLREMAAAGMDIQSHSLSHPFLTSINAAGKERYSKWLNRELRESKKIIENHLHKKVTLLAYPYGWFNNYVEKRCRRSGYRAVFTINYGVNRIMPERFRFDRFVMNGNMSQSVLKSLLTAKLLEFETNVPQAGETALGMTYLKFKLKNSKFKQVEVKFRSKRSKVRCDSEGFFTWQPNVKVPTGYQIVIVKVQDDNGVNYLGCWGFDYQLPVVAE
jgi:peptidoglycan/xylan/chitin deacetylase (PgdA/CDA1 family)